MSGTKEYRSYEPGIEGSYSEEEMRTLYIETVMKSEYPTFEGWVWDMLRSGVFEKIKN